MKKAVAIWILIAPAWNAASAPEACAGCHPAETKLHEKTRMAHAMTRAPGSLFALNIPDGPLRESNGGYLFTYQSQGDGLGVTAVRGTNQAEGLIEWVLGAGAQGQTPLVETAAGMRESRVSYFPELHRYGITVGQDAGSSANADAALGRKLTPADIENCLACHSTGVVREGLPAVAGVQCERCHPGADEHARGNSKLPLNPGKLAAVEQVRFCGACHRNNAPVDDKQLENIRFQPLRLMKSRCFASGKLACTTCHPAHQDARRNAAAFYNEKCLACHAGPVPHKDERAKGDCIGCHMPYVQLHPALKFTDHYIRVVKAGDLPASLIEQRGTGSGT